MFKKIYHYFRKFFNRNSTYRIHIIGPGGGGGGSGQPTAANEENGNGGNKPLYQVQGVGGGGPVGLAEKVGRGATPSGQFTLIVKAPDVSSISFTIGGGKRHDD